MNADEYVVPLMHEGQVTATTETARRLLRTQFPEWAELSLTPIPGGTDHALFRLGDELLLRFPLTETRGHATVDARWLPLLAPHLPLSVPVPLALGVPDESYPWHWTMVPWISGTRLQPSELDLRQPAVDLARFVRALHSAPALDGPGVIAGQRGSPVRQLDQRVRMLVGQLTDQIDVRAVTAAWDRVMATREWSGDPVWLHTDIGPDNVIVEGGRVVGVIDFGLGRGDPAPDLLPAWLVFTGRSRDRFLDEVGYDADTCIRALAWLLVPALQGLIYYRGTRPDFVARSRWHLDLAVAALHAT